MKKLTKVPPSKLRQTSGLQNNAFCDIPSYAWQLAQDAANNTLVSIIVTEKDYLINIEFPGYVQWIYILGR